MKRLINPALLIMFIVFPLLVGCQQQSAPTAATPTPPPTPADLTFYTPSGESGPLAIVEVKGSDNEWYISAHVKNSGGTTANNVVVALGSKGKRGHVWQIPNLASWETKSLEVPLEEVMANLNLNPGTHPFGLNIDPKNTIEESDETNNKYTGQLTIPKLAPVPTPKPEPLIDLTFMPIADWEGSPMAIGTAELIGSPEEFKGNDPSAVYLFCTLQNKQRQYVKDLKLRYFVDGYEVYEHTFIDTPINSSKIRISVFLKNLSTLPGKPLSPGMHSFEIIIDPENEIAESDETNNRHVAELEVPADYFQSSYAPTPAPVPAPSSTPVPPTQLIYALKVTVRPAGAGNVILNPSGGSYPSGTKVTLTVALPTNYQFAGWSGDIGGTNPVMIIIMNKNITVTAHFVPKGW